jgi:hypothetical protein
VQDRDGLEWFVSANANDLAAKVKMELAFEPKEGVEYGLQVTYRQSLMSTYLFYGTLQAMGSDYGRRW